MSTLCARRENAVGVPWARRVRAVNTLQQLLARCENVMDAVKTLWEHCVDAVGTPWGRCEHAITDKFDIFLAYSVAIPQRADMVLERCTNAVASPLGLIAVSSFLHVA